MLKFIDGFDQYQAQAGRCCSVVLRLPATSCRKGSR